MKQKYVVMLLSVVLLLSTGCMGMFKQSVKSQEKLEQKTEQIEQKKTELANNNEVKLKEIGVVSTGVKYALSKETNASRTVSVATDLNDRVISLAGNPDIKDVVRIKRIVDELVSEVESERKIGIVEKNRLDLELQTTQSQREALQKSFDKQNEDYKKLSEHIAELSDKNAAVVNSMDSWFGLGAVFYGLKKFFFSFVTVLVIGSILFLILRILSQTNHFAATVFSVFEHAGSSILHLIKAVIPKSFDFASFVPKETSETYRESLDKIVDTLQTLKERNLLAADDKKVKLDDVFVELDKKLDSDEKSTVTDRLRSMGWKI